METKKIAVYIPARNVSHIIPVVLDRIPAQLKNKIAEIIVVDNASKDNTYLTLIGYQQQKGVQNLRIIKNEKDLGYGGSQKLAYNYCLEKGYDIVAMLHGDAQYAPEYLPTLIKPVEEGKAEMVFGSRMAGNPLKGGMPLWKYLGNRGLTAIENSILGLNLSEYHSGYRVFSCAALRKVPFHLCTDQYYFDTEIFIQFQLAGLRIAEAPIPTHYGKESRNIGPKDLYVYCSNVLKTVGRYWLHKKGLKHYKLFEVPSARQKE